MKNDEIKFMILEIVGEIPYGKVASYGQVAQLSGYPKKIRQVASILSKSPEAEDYPCHRVVHNDGSLVKYWDDQKALLEAEGIVVVNGKVDMVKYRWE